MPNRDLPMLPECQLFGTLGCHLCEVAEAVLMPFVDHGLLVELVDIAESEPLFELLRPDHSSVATLRQCRRAAPGRSMPNRWWRSLGNEGRRGVATLLHDL